MVSVSCFGVKVSVRFHFMLVHYTINSVWVAGGHRGRVGKVAEFQRS